MKAWFFRWWPLLIATAFAVAHIVIVERAKTTATTIADTKHEAADLKQDNAALNDDIRKQERLNEIRDHAPDAWGYADILQRAEF